MRSSCHRSREKTMKKFLISICLCALGISGYAQQKGDMGVGFNLGAAPAFVKEGPSVTNFGIGAKFQYNVTNPIRLEADLDYWFKARGMDVFDISANIQYVFKLGEKINFYPLVGIGYAKRGGGVEFAPDYDHSGDHLMNEDALSYSSNSFLVNAGVGLEYNLSNNLSAGLEIKYQYLKDLNRVPITIGITYHF